MFSTHGFFEKLIGFVLMFKRLCLLPHRVEFGRDPSEVNRFLSMVQWRVRSSFCDSEPGPSFAALTLGHCLFESPKNPHSGCFVLSSSQLQAWKDSGHWLDEDASFVSPLESAATLGIAKTFRLYKPVMAMGSWLELQHWGRSFHGLLGNVISLPTQDDEQDTNVAKVSSQLQN